MRVVEGDLVCGVPADVGEAGGNACYGGRDREFGALPIETPSSIVPTVQMASAGKQQDQHRWGGLQLSGARQGLD